MDRLDTSREERLQELRRQLLRAASSRDDEYGMSVRAAFPEQQEERIERLRELRAEQQRIESQRFEQERGEGFRGEPTRTERAASAVGGFAREAVAPIRRAGLGLATALPGIGLQSQLARQLERGEITQEQHDETIDTILREMNITPDMSRARATRQVGADVGLTGLSALGGAQVGQVIRGGQTLRAGRALRTGRLERGTSMAGTPGATARTAEQAARRRALTAQTATDTTLGAGISGAYRAGDPEATGGQIAAEAAIGGALGGVLAGGIGGALSAREGRRLAQRASAEAIDAIPTQPVIRAMTAEELTPDVPRLTGRKDLAYEPAGETLYHGGAPIDDKTLSSSELGYSLTSNERVADWFAKKGGGSAVTAYRLKPSARVLKTDDIPQRLKDNFTEFDPNKSLAENIKDTPARRKDAERQLVKYARDNNYDAIDMRGKPFVLGGDFVLDNEAEVRILASNAVEAVPQPSVNVPRLMAPAERPAGTGVVREAAFEFDPALQQRYNEIDSQLTAAQREGASITPERARQLMREREELAERLVASGKRAESPNQQIGASGQQTTNEVVGTINASTDTASGASQVASRASNAARIINDKLGVSDYTGRITDNLSSFFKSLEGVLESTGGREITSNFYRRVIGGIANRNEHQQVLARTLNANLGWTNRQKRQLGNQVGDLLRTVPNEDMASMTAEQIARQYNTSTDIASAAQTVRRHFDDMLEAVNEARAAQGRNAIEYREQYMPQWARRGRVSDQAGVTEETGLEEIFTAFAQRRGAQEADFERNVFRVLDQYHRGAANEVYLQPVVNTLRQMSRELAPINQRAASFLNEFIDTGIMKTRPAGWDRAWGIERGTARHRVLQRIALARSLSGLVGNIRWMIFTMPQTLSVTAGKFGVRNTARGMLDYFTDPNIRREVQDLEIFRLKRGSSVGATAGGQLDRLAESVLKTRREFLNDFMNVPANFIETVLDGSSAAAARRAAIDGVQTGSMTGQGLRNYMNHAIEVTQSVYAPETRALIAQNLMTRSGFPFQTYSTEMWRHVNNLARGKGAGWNQTAAGRLQQATTMITAIVLANELQKMATGRNLATPGSVVPYVGDGVNMAVDGIFGTEFSFSDNLQLTAFQGDARRLQQIYGDLQESVDERDGQLIEGVKEYIENGNTRRLRSLAVTWGLGFSGIGGAATVNNIIDVAQAYNNEVIGVSRGNEIPFDRNLGNVLATSLSGIYSSPDVRSYYELQDQIWETSQERGRINTQINELIRAGNITEASVLAGRYNQQLAELEQRLQRENVSDRSDIQERIDRLKYPMTGGSLSEQSIRSRRNQ